MKSLGAIVTVFSFPRPLNQHLLPVRTPKRTTFCGTVNLQGAVSVILPAKLMGSGKVARSTVSGSSSGRVIRFIIHNVAIGKCHSLLWR